MTQPDLPQVVLLSMTPQELSSLCRQGLALVRACQVLSHDTVNLESESIIK